MMFRNKKGAEYLAKKIIFIILNILFVAAFLFFIGWKSSGAGVYEQIYAKQIALLIDQAKPGTEVTIDISKLYEAARKEEYYPEKGLVDISAEKKEVRVKLTSQGEGYILKYTNNAVVVWGENKHYETFYIKIKPKGAE